VLGPDEPFECSLCSGWEATAALDRGEHVAQVGVCEQLRACDRFGKSVEASLGHPPAVRIWLWVLADIEQCDDSGFLAGAVHHGASAGAIVSQARGMILEAIDDRPLELVWLENVYGSWYRSTGFGMSQELSRLGVIRLRNEALSRKRIKKPMGDLVAVDPDGAAILALRTPWLNEAECVRASLQRRRQHAGHRAGTDRAYPISERNRINAMRRLA
jgi:hypothetical protein